MSATTESESVNVSWEERLDQNNTQLQQIVAINNYAKNIRV